MGWGLELRVHLTVSKEWWTYRVFSNHCTSSSGSVRPTLCLLRWRQARWMESKRPITEFSCFSKALCVNPISSTCYRLHLHYLTEGALTQLPGRFCSNNSKGHRHLISLPYLMLIMLSFSELASLAAFVAPLSPCFLSSCPSHSFSCNSSVPQAPTLWPGPA